MLNGKSGLRIGVSRHQAAENAVNDAAEAIANVQKEPIRQVPKVAKVKTPDVSRSTVMVLQVVLAAVLCPKAGAVNGYGFLSHLLPAAHEANKLAEHSFDLFGVSFAEVSDGMVLGQQVVAKPHHFHIAAALLFQPPGRADAI